MTNESGTTAISSSGPPVEPGPDPATGPGAGGARRPAGSGAPAPDTTTRGEAGRDDANRDATTGGAASGADARGADARGEADRDATARGAGARGGASRGGAPAVGSAGPALAPGAGGFAIVALAWLAAMLWSAQAAITSANVDSMAITSAAYALPGVISASLVSGAAAGLTLTNLLTRRGATRGTPRFAAAVGAGLATGLLAALAVTVSYGDGPAIMVLAGTTAAAATIGGAFGGLRTGPAVGAVVTARLAVFAVGFVLSFFQDPVLSLYGSGDTQESQVAALRWFSRTASVCGGLAAGLVAFGYLRWSQRRATARGGEHSLRWPVYLIAGAGPGLLLLAAEALTRTAGARLLALAGALSEADRAAQSMLGGSRLNHALGVLFLGSFTALIAFGRTLRPPADPADEPTDRPPAGPADRAAAAPDERTRARGAREPAGPGDEDGMIATTTTVRTDDKAGAPGW
jgi:hypothetical protein